MFIILQEFHPINKLRNIGLKNAQTPYVFLADIDFIPSQDLYDTLRKYIKQMGSLRKKVNKKNNPFVCCN